MNRNRLILPAVFFFAILIHGALVCPRLSAETLEDAWRTALAVDLRLSASKMMVESMRQSLTASKASRLPEVSLESAYTFLDKAPAVKVQNGSFQMQEDKSLSFRSALVFPIYRGGLIASDIGAAESALRAAVHDEKKNVLDVKLDVGRTYIDVLRSRKNVGVAQSSVDNLSAHSKDVSNFYEEGMVTKNELLAAQVSLADASQRLSQEMNTTILAEASYNRLLGRPLESEVTIEDISPRKFEVQQANLTATALMNRPELGSIAEQADALEYRSSAVRSGLLPQISFSGAFDYQQNKYQVHEDIWSGILAIRWRLFDGGVTRHNAASLQQNASALREVRSNMASFIALEVRRAELDVSETRNRIAVTKGAMEQAEENLRMVKDRYREGVGTNTEVLDAEALRVKTCANYYNAMYDAVMAEIRLKYASGTL